MTLQVSVIGIDGSGKSTLIIDTTLARWFALEGFHLLGYRKRRSEEGKLVVSRRRFDHRSPRVA